MPKSPTPSVDLVLNPPTQVESRQYRIVNMMLQKLVINVVIDGQQESIELGVKEKSRAYPTNEFGPHVETLRKAHHLRIEAA